MKKDTKSLLWGFLAGSVAGSVTALLFAPKPGKELRKDIADGASSTIEKVQDIASQAGEKSSELYDKAKESVESVVQEVREWRQQHCTQAEEEKLAVSGISADEAAASIDETAVQDDTDKDEIV